MHDHVVPVVLPDVKRCDDVFRSGLCTLLRRGGRGQVGVDMSTARVGPVDPAVYLFEGP